MARFDLDNCKLRLQTLAVGLKMIFAFPRTTEFGLFTREHNVVLPGVNQGKAL